MKKKKEISVYNFVIGCEYLQGKRKIEPVSDEIIKEKAAAIFSKIDNEKVIHEINIGIENILKSVEA